ncbi:MAG: shikimate kinase [Lutibacter sp.]|jgi:shikimate kinase|nr:shikimate kinase [Lutibacter sp.]MBP9600922.1 shikimate kinase [Lutibacter sp.]
MKIVLMGYMASGKSAIGKILAQKLNLQFIDLDDFIEENEKLTIAEIFKLKGEIYFRIKEGEYLEKILKNFKNCVISLGGGTPCYGNNIKIIKNNSISFYLSASVSTIFNRLKDEKSKRPLVSSLIEDDLKEYIAKHLFERTQFYNQADHILSVNKNTIEEIAEEILTITN